MHAQISQMPSRLGSGSWNSKPNMFSPNFRYYETRLYNEIHFQKGEFEVCAGRSGTTSCEYLTKPKTSRLYQNIR